jgi:hypothetical protein
MMKRCAICKLVKDAYDGKQSAFAKDSSRKDGFQNKCKDCQKVLSNKHYVENKRDYFDRSAELRRVLRKEVAHLKEASPCADCGNFYPHYVMDYDHLGEIQKVDSVSRLITIKAGRRAVMEEIEKCELVCSNCHRVRTHERKVAVGLDDVEDVEVVSVV